MELFPNITEPTFDMNQKTANNYNPAAYDTPVLQIASRKQKSTEVEQLGEFFGKTVSAIPSLGYTLENATPSVNEKQDQRQRVECSNCGKKLLEKSLPAHQATHQANRETFGCHCGKEYYHERSLKRDIKLSHPSPPIDPTLLF